MRDIAEAAGVSRTTVSLILNEKSDVRIPERTRELVRETARQLDYRPSVLARELRTQTSSIVGFIGDEIASGPFGGELIAGAQSALSESGRVLMVVNTGAEGDLASAPLSVFSDRGVDSIILATVLTREVEIPADLWDGSSVLLNCFSRLPESRSILPDDYAGGRAAARHLLGLGHRSFAYVGGEAESHPIARRLAGVRDELATHDLGLPDSHVVTRGWHADAGYDGMVELDARDALPTAVVCGNDRVALGVLDWAKHRSIDVPSQLSVVGFDDQEEIAAYTHPPLTTLRLPYREMGRAAIALLTGPAGESRTLDCPLIERASTAPPPGR